MDTPNATKTVAKKLTKEEQGKIWASEGRCVECGKPVLKTHEGMGTTCFEHQGKMRRNATIAETVPTGWIRMSEVCRKAVEQGITVSAVVTAAGGDGAVDALLDPMFKVTYVGKGKWMDPRVLTDGFAMIKAKKEAPAEPAPKAKKVSGNNGKGASKDESAPADTADALRKAVIK